MGSMSGEERLESPQEIETERDLYRRLLDLGMQHDVEPFLEDALQLLVQVAGARRGAIRLWDRWSPTAEPLYSIQQGLSEEDGSTSFSQSVIAETFATGETIVTASAQNDPRFQDRRSVRANRLQAVLCVPIGRLPMLGVVYLQDRPQPGPFDAEDQARAEMFARHLGTFVDLLLLRRRQQQGTGNEIREGFKSDDLVGRSPAVLEMLRHASVVARVKVGVLLTGPSGSGKTQLARLIHENGPHASGPFVEINCGAIPSELVENELFGAAPGAHATAVKKVPGKVAAADGGTLFLDEVGELPKRAQASLLQFLQSKTYFPLGSATPQRANVRIIAATNADLDRAVRDGGFREDLYYRLNVYAIRVPSLQERRDDISALAVHLCKQACDLNDLPRMELSNGALRALEAAEWPGNIRALANVVESAAIRAHGDGGPRIERRHVFPEPPTNAVEAPPAGSFHAATRRFQETLVRNALRESDHNVSAAARSLDITRAHLYNLMATFGISRQP
jgi:Nif-specific regulatory protein